MAFNENKEKSRGISAKQIVHIDFPRVPHRSGSSVEGEFCVVLCCFLGLSHLICLGGFCLLRSLQLSRQFQTNLHDCHHHRKNRYFLKRKKWSRICGAIASQRLLQDATTTSLDLVCLFCFILNKNIERNVAVRHRLTRFVVGILIFVQICSSEEDTMKRTATMIWMRCFFAHFVLKISTLLDFVATSMRIIRLKLKTG